MLLQTATSSTTSPLSAFSVCFFSEQERAHTHLKTRSISGSCISAAIVPRMPRTTTLLLLCRMSMHDARGSCRRRHCDNVFPHPYIHFYLISFLSYVVLLQLFNILFRFRFARWPFLAPIWLCAHLITVVCFLFAECHINTSFVCVLVLSQPYSILTSCWLRCVPFVTALYISYVCCSLQLRAVRMLCHCPCNFNFIVFLVGKTLR